ncbi:hypothetical protein RRG08_033742 [Elysia crispata]|uniref:Uncharacterized protein n=1 Tax=Elysia crispata TaxID=231223 RepID=A0AAE1A8Y2_9GAST|nr:hypothetical protein RRG08_033742 [Elysia crispata]
MVILNSANILSRNSEFDNASFISASKKVPGFTLTICKSLVPPGCYRLRTACTGVDVSVCLGLFVISSTQARGNPPWTGHLT